MTEQERTLIAGCVKGEKAAWDAFVLQYSKLVYDTVIRTLRLYHAQMDDSFKDDLYQDFFVALAANDFHKLRQFKGLNSCTLASWLKAIANRLTIDFLRKLKNPTVELMENFPADQLNSAETLLDREQERLLYQAIDGLSNRDKLLISLHFRKGLGPEEIATIMHISVPAFYTQKSRLLDRLREILKESGAL